MSAAVQRADGSLLPHPPTLAATPSDADKAVAQLVKRGFIEERENTDAANSHRDDSERRLGMFITDAGKAAIGIVDEDPDPAAQLAPQPRPQPEPQPEPEPEPARPSKRSAVVELLHRDQGATLAELIELTSWLPHTTRAALTACGTRAMSSPAPSAGPRLAITSWVLFKDGAASYAPGCADDNAVSAAKGSLARANAVAGPQN